MRPVRCHVKYHVRENRSKHAAMLPHTQSSDKARSKASVRNSASSVVMHIGGLMRKTLPCNPPLPIRTPNSLNLCMTCKQDA